MAFMLAGCELSSGFEDLTKIFDGETREAPVEQAATDAEQPRSEPAEPADTTDTADTAETGPTREMTLTAQTLLVGRGYDPGPLDGFDGPMTRDAVRRYQADTGTLVDGRITKALIEKLSESDHDEAARNENDDIDLASKALPLYAAGDTFIYSDGRTETVTDIDGDLVRWRSNNGSVTTAFRDFVLPAIGRESDFLSEQTTVDAEPGALWPLKVGREISFTAKSEVTHKFSPSSRSELTAQWQCLVDPPRPLDVAAGTFDALRVVCRRSTPSAQGPTERVWYYAPRIRHYVRMEERFEDPASDSQVDLVAVQPEGKSWPPAAWAGLGWALQQALETKSEKESIEWRSTGVDAEVTIRPTTAMNTGASPYCRTFEQTVRRTHGQRIYPGKACRGPSGLWLIPGLETMPQDARSGS